MTMMLESHQNMSDVFRIFPNAMCENLHWTNESSNWFVSLYIKVYQIVRCWEAPLIGVTWCYLDIFQTALLFEARGLQTEGAGDGDIQDIRR